MIVHSSFSVRRWWKIIGAFTATYLALLLLVLLFAADFSALLLLVQLLLLLWCCFLLLHLLCCKFSPLSGIRVEPQVHWVAVAEAKKRPLAQFIGILQEL